MSSSQKLFLQFALFSLISVTVIHGKKIILDQESDRTKDFLDIDCYYAEDHVDFLPWGCSVQPPADRGEPGFWNPCLRPECGIIFNTGILPLPIAIEITAVVTGSSSIQLLGVKSLANISEWETIATIGETTGWETTTVDLTDLVDIFIFKINAKSSLDGYALIDQIAVDLGEVTEPTTTTDVPTTTTPSPEESGYVLLDKEGYNPKHWPEILCHYTSHYDDFSHAWGCETDLAVAADGEPSVGYWSSCQRSSCNIQYHGGILAKPVGLKVGAYIKGDAEIQVLGKRSAYDGEDSAVGLYTIQVANNLGYCNKIEMLSLSDFDNVFAVNVKLTSSRDGFALVDKVSIHLKDGVEDEFESSIVGDVPCNVFLTPVLPTNPTWKPSTEPGGGDSGSNGRQINLTILVSFAVFLGLKYFA